MLNNQVTEHETTLGNGYYLASMNSDFATAEGGQESWEEFKRFVKSECGDASRLFVWHVNNGTAHLLSVRAASLI